MTKPLSPSYTKPSQFNRFFNAAVRDFTYLRFNDLTGEVQAGKTRARGIAGFDDWIAAKNRASPNVGGGWRYTPPG